MQAANHQRIGLRCVRAPWPRDGARTKFAPVEKFVAPLFQQSLHRSGACQQSPPRAETEQIRSIPRASLHGAYHIPQQGHCRMFSVQHFDNQFDTGQDDCELIVQVMAGGSGHRIRLVYLAQAVHDLRYRIPAGLPAFDSRKSFQNHENLFGIGCDSNLFESKRGQRIQAR